LPKTETAQLKELKNLLINSAGTRVVHKAVEIALNDEHPAQLAAIKLCMDRMLPVSMFEKEGKQRSAVTHQYYGYRRGFPCPNHRRRSVEVKDDEARKQELQHLKERVAYLEGILLTLQGQRTMSNLFNS